MGGSCRRLKSSSTALPNPPACALSSMVNTLPVLSAQWQISSLSKGLTNRGLITAASMPPFSKPWLLPGRDRHGCRPAAAGCRLPSAEHFAFADRQFLESAAELHILAGAAWIADGCRTVMEDGGVEHVLQFVFVLGRHEHQVGDNTQERESKTPWWVGPSSPTTPARSMAKVTGRFGQADIMDDLVHGTAGRKVE